MMRAVVALAVVSLFASADAKDAQAPVQVHSNPIASQQPKFSFKTQEGPGPHSAEPGQPPKFSSKPVDGPGPHSAEPRQLLKFSLKPQEGAGPHSAEPGQPPRFSSQPQGAGPYSTEPGQPPKFLKPQGAGTHSAEPGQPPKFSSEPLNGAGPHSAEPGQPPRFSSKPLDGAGPHSAEPGQPPKFSSLPKPQGGAGPHQLASVAPKDGIVGKTSQLPAGAGGPPSPVSKLPDGRHAKHSPHSARPPRFSKAPILPIPSSSAAPFGGKQPEDNSQLIPLGDEQQGRSGFNPWDLLSFPWWRHSPGDRPEEHSLPPLPSVRPSDAPFWAPHGPNDRHPDEFSAPPPEHSGFSFWDLLPWARHSPGDHPEDHPEPEPWEQPPARQSDEPWGPPAFPDHPEDHSEVPKPWGPFPPQQSGQPRGPPAFPPRHFPKRGAPGGFPREPASVAPPKSSGFLQSGKPWDALPFPLHPPSDVSLPTGSGKPPVPEEEPRFPPFVASGESLPSPPPRHSLGKIPDDQSAPHGPRDTRGQP